jgi:hypothetical protein
VLWVTKADAAGVDQSLYLKSLVFGSLVFVSATASPGAYLKGTVVGTPADNTTFITIPLQWTEKGSAISNGAQVVVSYNLVGPGVLLINAGATPPSGTPVGTLIYEKA